MRVLCLSTASLVACLVSSSAAAATSLVGRATITNCQYSVDVGAWCGEAMRERADILDDEGGWSWFYPSAASQQAFLALETTNSAASYSGIASDRDDDDTYNMNYFSPPGDNELRARNIELNLTIPIHTNRDWANPGCQNMNNFGP